MADARERFEKKLSHQRPVSVSATDICIAELLQLL